MKEASTYRRLLGLLLLSVFLLSLGVRGVHLLVDHSEWKPPCPAGEFTHFHAEGDEHDNGCLLCFLQSNSLTGPVLTEWMEAPVFHTSTLTAQEDTFATFLFESVKKQRGPPTV